LSGRLKLSVAIPLTTFNSMRSAPTVDDSKLLDGTALEATVFEVIV
jgi:hypothetical protein